MEHGRASVCHGNPDNAVGENMNFKLNRTVIGRYEISNWKKNTQKNITRNMNNYQILYMCICICICMCVCIYIYRYMNFILASYGNERGHCTWLIEYAKWTFTDYLTDWTFNWLICLWLCIAIRIRYDVRIGIYACAGGIVRAMLRDASSDASWCKQVSKTDGERVHNNWESGRNGSQVFGIQVGMYQVRDTGVNAFNRMILCGEIGVSVWHSITSHCSSQQ